MLSGTPLKRIKQILRLIYSKEHSEVYFSDLKNLMDLYRKDEVITEKKEKYRNRSLLSEKDAFLITYADTLYRKGEKPLRTLHRFLKKHLKDRVTGIHLLPFFPSSSDAGYAVIN